MIKYIKRGFGALVTLLFLCHNIWAEDFFKTDSPPVGGPAVVKSLVLPDFTALVKELSASVVNVSVEGGLGDDATSEQDPATPPIPKKESDSPFRSVGSGFVVNEDGFIVTNFHVVGSSDNIIVRLLNDKTEYHATIIGKDQKTDLALIKIDPKTKLKPVALGDSDDLQVGEWVLAIGNQFQLGQTVTAGIVSAKSRKVPTRGGPYDSFIQTDASINPGSSGGPLFNTKGYVVGINSAIFSPGRSQMGGSGFNIGIGFSIPINQAKKVLMQLKNQGKVTRGMLGVIIQPIDGDVAEAMGLKSQDGALVADVIPESPAARAGFMRRDVITDFDGHPIKDYDDLPLMVASTPINSRVQIGIIRAGRIDSLSAKIEELRDKGTTSEEKQKANEAGLFVQSVSGELAKSLGLLTSHGLLITGVESGSAGEKAGILRGDIIEEISGLSMRDADDFSRVIKSAGKKPLLITVRRKEGARLLVLKLK